MKTYICCETVEAKPMTRGNYNQYRGWTIPKDENPEDEGYLVKHNDNYINWIPKDDFERHHFELDTPKNELKELLELEQIDQLDLENFMGIDFKNRISLVSHEIGFYLGGTHKISYVVSDFENWMEAVYKLNSLSREIFTMLLELAVYGFNYRNGDKER